MAHYYFEFFKLGSYIKVVAIDPVTKLEISFSGAKGISKKELMRLAGLKLSKLIESKQKNIIMLDKEQEKLIKQEKIKWQNDNKNWLA